MGAPSATMVSPGVPGGAGMQFPPLSLLEAHVLPAVRALVSEPTAGEDEAVSVTAQGPASAVLRSIEPPGSPRHLTKSHLRRAQAILDEAIEAVLKDRGQAPGSLEGLGATSAVESIHNGAHSLETMGVAGAVPLAPMPAGAAAGSSRSRSDGGGSQSIGTIGSTNDAPPGSSGFFSWFGSPVIVKPPPASRLRQGSNGTGANIYAHGASPQDLCASHQQAAPEHQTGASTVPMQGNGNGSGGAGAGEGSGLPLNIGARVVQPKLARQTKPSLPVFARAGAAAQYLDSCGLVRGEVLLGLVTGAIDARVGMRGTVLVTTFRLRFVPDPPVEWRSRAEQYLESQSTESDTVERDAILAWLRPWVTPARRWRRSHHTAGDGATEPAVDRCLDDTPAPYDVMLPKELLPEGTATEADVVGGVTRGRTVSAASGRVACAQVSTRDRAIADIHRARSDRQHRPQDREAARFRRNMQKDSLMRTVKQTTGVAYRKARSLAMSSAGAIAERLGLGMPRPAVAEPGAFSTSEGTTERSSVYAGKLIGCTAGDAEPTAGSMTVPTAAPTTSAAGDAPAATHQGDETAEAKPPLQRVRAWSTDGRTASSIAVGVCGPHPALIGLPFVALDTEWACRARAFE